MTHPGIPMLALVPGQAPGTGAGTGYDVPPPPARRLDAAASAFDRARDGWLITRVTAVRPATAADPGLEEVTVPSLRDPAGRLRRLAVPCVDRIRLFQARPAARLGPLRGPRDGRGHRHDPH